MKNKYLISIYLMLILLIYETFIFKGLTYSKILFCVSILILLFLLKENKNKLKEIYMEKSFSFKFIIGILGFTMIVTISTFISILFNKQIYLTNIFEIVRGLLYILILLNLNLLLKNNQNIIIGKRIFIVFVIINCIIGISQFFNPFNVNELYIKTIAPTQYITLVNDYPYPRVIGLTGNPNVFGYILAITIILILSEIKKNPHIIKNYLITILLHITLYMTMSRTGFIIAVLGELLFIFFSIFDRKKIKNSLIKIIKYFLIIIVVEVGMLFLLPNDLTWRLKQLITLNKINSWEIRVNNNNKYIEDIIEDSTIDSNPNNISKSINNNIPKNIKFLIGKGADKTRVTEDSVYDNEYMLIFVRYGVIGLIAYLIMFIFPLIKMKNYNVSKKALFITFTIITLVYMYPAAIYHSFKLFGILMIVFSFIDIPNQKELNQKNILVIATNFPPCGGVGVFRITKFVKYLQIFGYNITVTTIADKYNLNKDENLMKNFKENTTIHRLDFSNKKESRISIDFYFALRKNLEKIIEDANPKVVLITGGPFYVLPIGRYIKNNFNIPYIIDLRDPWSTQKRNQKNFKSKTRYFIDNLLELYTFNQASAIITVNSTMTNDLKKKYPILKDNIYSISNGFDPDDFKEIIPKKMTGFTILYTGKFSVSAGFRNPENLFKAIKNLLNEGLDINFIHIGQKEEKIINLTKKYNINDHCQFLGLKSYSQTLEYCKGSDILVVISGNEKSEQTGKIFDYIGCNIPILAITNKKNELYKICKQSQMVFQVDPNSVKEIEEMIKNIYNNYQDNTIIYENNKLTREYLTKKLISIIEKK